MKKQKKQKQKKQTKTKTKHFYNVVKAIKEFVKNLKQCQN